MATASARALPLGALATTLGVVGPDPARLVRQASDALLAGAGKAGMIVGVDDAHLLDDLSAVLVHQLALRHAATVVPTVQAAEAAAGVLAHPRCSPAGLIWPGGVWRWPAGASTA